MFLLFLLLFNQFGNIILEEYLKKCSFGYYRNIDTTCEECSSLCPKKLTNVSFPKDCIEPCKNHVNSTVTYYSKSNKPIIEISTVQNYVNNTDTNYSKTNKKLGVIIGVIVVIVVIVVIIVVLVFIIYKKKKCGKYSFRSDSLNKSKSPHHSISDDNSQRVPITNMSDTEERMIEEIYEANSSNDVESSKFLFTSDFENVRKNLILASTISSSKKSEKCGKYSLRSDSLNKSKSSHHSISNDNIQRVSMVNMSDTEERMIEETYEANSSNDVESRNYFLVKCNQSSLRSLDTLNKNNECGKEDQSTGYNSMNNINNGDSISMINVPENMELNGRTFEDNSSNDIESENGSSIMISGQLTTTIPYLKTRR